MKDQESFKPYIPAEKITAEMTATSVIMGIILSVVFGAANAYLGLRVGMTVSASIPAAVISMGVIRVLLKKNSILESNMVQTIGSAGESLAAGAIFTMPALFLWAKEGLCDKPSILEITLIALCGGILGVLFMVPLRNALIVKEHATLLYPEGTACADVLLAGEEGGANASTVFSGMGLAAIFKFIVDGLKMIPSDIAVAFSSFKGALGMEVYPALLGVGYIVGPKTASYMFAGSLVGWMVIIPLICLFGANISLYPAAAGTTIADLYAAGQKTLDAQKAASQAAAKASSGASRNAAGSAPAKKNTGTASSGKKTGQMVWIPTHGGKKYHSNPNCSGMKGPEKVDISTAKARGFTACKKCY